MNNNLNDSSNFDGLNLPLEMTEEEREVAKIMVDEAVSFTKNYTANKSRFSLFKVGKSYLKKLFNPIKL